MKKIEAIIEPSRIRKVKQALSELGVNKMVVAEVKEFGLHNDHVAIYRGHEQLMDFLPYLKIEVVVTDEQLESAVEAIAEAAKMGSNGESEMYIYAVEQTVRIGTPLLNGISPHNRSC